MFEALIARPGLLRTLLLCAGEIETVMANANVAKHISVRNLDVSTSTNRDACTNCDARLSRVAGISRVASLMSEGAH
jgi:hypothetical protein